MRDFINNSMPALIWITLVFMVVTSFGSGTMIIVEGFKSNLVFLVFTGFFGMIFGLTTSFLFAGFCFQVLDIRRFTKITAQNTKR